MNGHGIRQNGSGTSITRVSRAARMSRLAAAIVMAVPVSAAVAAPPRDVTFRRQVLSERFLAEGCDMADFDRDGHVDITAGWFIWHGPDFIRRTEFTAAPDNAAGPSKTS
jgi:hypothetical protein